jgi:hypothetical protein
MTDSTGRAFISYRRGRRAEAEQLALALHDIGVPTWQDVTNLEAEPTAEELRKVLRDPFVACGLVWITPEARDSDVIRKIELPEILARRRADDGFFVQPVAAGGLDYAQAGEIASRYLGIEDLGGWNLTRADGDPIDAAEAAGIAELVLRRRLKEIVATLGDGRPVRLSLHTRERAPAVAGIALTLDWSDRFDGRCAPSDVWQYRLLPAVTVTSATLRELAPGRPVEAEGLCVLPAAVALGAAFLAPAGPELRWRQRRVGATDQVWSLSAPRDTAEVDIETNEIDATSEDMAVVVSINHNAEEALRESPDEVPRFRGHVCLRGKDGGLADLRTPGEATDAVMRLVEAIKTTRHEWRDIRRIHLFLAGPAGFAVLLGQLLNGLGPVQTYEHLQDDAVGRYCRAALLHAGA